MIWILAGACVLGYGAIFLLRNDHDNRMGCWILVALMALGLIGGVVLAVPPDGGCSRYSYLVNDC